MKKIMCMIFILLTSCAPAPASLPLVSSSFTYNQECPHVCWMGINPGVTTAEEAVVLLNSSSQINQHSHVKHVGTIIMEWHTEQMGGGLPSRVYVGIENGIVKELVFNFYTIVKIREFIDLFGEPDEISVRQELWTSGVNTDYLAYYTSKKIVMFVLIAGENGPDPSNSVSDLYLNVSPDDPNAFAYFLEHKDLRQPWLGFGHLDEYLKNRPSPLE